MVETFRIKRTLKIFIYKNTTVGTPTERIIKGIVYFKEVLVVFILSTIVIPFLITLCLYCSYLIINWFFTADHANSEWIWFVKDFWWSWYLVRGTIFFTFVGLAWKQIKQFPKIVYFKDLKFIFSRAFLMIYCLVLIFTVVKVVQDIAFGIIHTPLYQYYAQWLHLA
ncbi:hypothetical protein IB687_07265 [Francisella tularensis subsp. novicida FSC595]|nr:hypothetical protein [Francisella tularensis subsp. novicida FSC595]